MSIANLLLIVVFKLFKAVILAFKSILFDKLEVSFFCNSKLVSFFCNKSAVSMMFNFKVNALFTSVILSTFAFRLILFDKLKVSAPFNLEFKESFSFCWVNNPMATQPLLLKSAVANLYNESLACTNTNIPCFLLFTGSAFLVVKSGSVIRPPLPKLSIWVGYTATPAVVILPVMAI